MLDIVLCTYPYAIIFVKMYNIYSNVHICVGNRILEYYTVFYMEMFC